MFAEVGLVEASLPPVRAALALGAVAERAGAAVDGSVAVVEMASASGLQLLSGQERDVWRASALGTAQLLAWARRRGVEAILLGAGGSATSDLGLGALEALLSTSSPSGSTLRQRVRDADLVLTGEGRFDRGSRHGKGPFALLQLAQRLGVPACAFVGAVADDTSPGSLAIEATTPAGMPREGA